MIEFETYTEWRGNEYVTTTKVYDTDKLVPGWIGCHWDNPAIIASEAVEGTNMSSDMLKIINELGAVEIEEDDFEEDDKEYFPSSMLKLKNRNYSRRLNTYNACWLNPDGSPAMWGNYCLDDGSYYLATGREIVASGYWYSGTGLEEDAVFQTQGVYTFDDVRLALQTGILIH